MSLKSEYPLSEILGMKEAEVDILEEGKTYRFKGIFHPKVGDSIMLIYVESIEPAKCHMLFADIIEG